MSQVTTSRVNQRNALLEVLASGKRFTMDELISRVSNRTGRSVKPASLTVQMSKLRSDGFTIVSQPDEGSWRYYLNGKANRDRARQEVRSKPARRKSVAQSVGASV